jgi:RNA polymerase sigma-70 factor (ECF subfamily)
MLLAAVLPAAHARSGSSRAVIAQAGAANSALQRAHKVVDSSGASRQSELRQLGPEGVEEIVTRWATAWHAGDIEAIVGMLAADARARTGECPTSRASEGRIKECAAVPGR